MLIIQYPIYFLFPFTAMTVSGSTRIPVLNNYMGMYVNIDVERWGRLLSIL